MTDYTPTPEAVEVAARAMLTTRLPSGGLATLNEAQSRVLAEAVLTAAGPLIAAEALREAAESPTSEEFLRGLPEGEYGENAVQTGREWLRGRGARIARGEGS